MRAPRPAAPAPAPARALSRRGVLTAVGALGLGGLLAACGSDGDSDSEGGGTTNSPAGGGTWRFKDDRGTTAEADRTPKRLVAFVGAAAAPHDLGIECTGVFGPTKLKNGKPDPRAGGIDVDKVTILGNTYPQFDVERYAGLRPDLLIAQMTDPPALWYVPEESAEKIESLAPSVGILTTKSSLTHVIGRFTDLAKSLGADLTADPVTSAEERFKSASALAPSGGSGPREGPWRPEAHGGLRLGRHPVRRRPGRLHGPALLRVLSCRRTRTPSGRRRWPRGTVWRRARRTAGRRPRVRDGCRPPVPAPRP